MRKTITHYTVCIEKVMPNGSKILNHPISPRFRKSDDCLSFKEKYGLTGDIIEAIVFCQDDAEFSDIDACLA